LSIRHASEEGFSFPPASKLERGSSISRPETKIADVPDAPSAPSATDVGTSRALNNGAATVSFTPATTGGAPSSYTVTSNPGSFTGTGASSPVTVTGLASATSYTFSVTATNSTGTSSSSSASASITATTVPGAPTVGTPTVPTGQAYGANANVSVPFTAPTSSGGKTITSYTVTSSSGNTGSGSSSPITVSDVVGTARTYTVTATNANGTGSASSASSSATPVTVPQAPTIGTATDLGTGTTVSVAFTAGATGGSSITGYSVTSSPTTTTQSASSSPYTFTGLTAGTSYTFQVAATNANGTSSYSSASNSVTPVVPSSFYSIATATGTGSNNTITFSSIPSTYKSLHIRFMSRSTVSPTYLQFMQFNGSTGSVYAMHDLETDGTTIFPYGYANQTQIYIGGLNIPPITNSSDTAGIFGVGVVDIIDYASTSKYKTVRYFVGKDKNISGNGTPQIGSGLFMDTTAISSITITMGQSGNFATGSTFALYGVK
jgi:Fibronectin type III domain